MSGSVGKAPQTPADSKLLAALTGAGADWDMGAGHGAMQLDITCAIAAATCTFAGGTTVDIPVAPASAAKAKAVIAALTAEGAKPAGDKLAAHVDCTMMDEGFPDGLTPADSCDVTAVP